MGRSPVLVLQPVLIEQALRAKRKSFGRKRRDERRRAQGKRGFVLPGELGCGMTELNEYLSVPFAGGLLSPTRSKP
jgi:hypothetical protein